MQITVLTCGADNFCGYNRKFYVKADLHLIVRAHYSSRIQNNSLTNAHDRQGLWLRNNRSTGRRTYTIKWRSTLRNFVYNLFLEFWGTEILGVDFVLSKTVFYLIYTFCKHAYK